MPTPEPPDGAALLDRVADVGGARDAAVADQDAGPLLKPLVGSRQPQDQRHASIPAPVIDRLRFGALHNQRFRHRTKKPSPPSPPASAHPTIRD